MYTKYQFYPTNILNFFYFLTFWTWSKFVRVWELTGEFVFVGKSEFVFVGESEFVVETKISVWVAKN